ncbi:hypothetical protein BGZ65_009657, partial [Modicella reniformis]
MNIVAALGLGSAFDPQTFTSSEFSGVQLGLDGLIGNTPIWENNAVPSDQAYDEFVFDLTPSHFETPATVNVADLIVGPHSMASAGTPTATSVSPLELSIANTTSDYDQDLALANLYGFNEPSTGTESDSEESDAEDSDDFDEDDEGDDSNDESEVPKNAMKIATESAPIIAKAAAQVIQAVNVTVQGNVHQHQVNLDAAAVVITPIAKPEDPNKRRMEEALAARISNDLGPEHMAGLFKILR